MSDTEGTLLAILRRHLHEPEIGVDDDFYAFGGDSMIALRVVADATEQGIPVELLDILHFPTVRELVAALADRGHRVGGPVDPGPFGLLDPYDRAMLPAGLADARPASALPVGMIYLCETSGDPSLYHDLIGFEVAGRFDADLFGRALAELCDRHESLRSSFDLGGFSEAVQLVWSAVPPPLTVEHASTVDAVGSWRAAQLARPIDWARAPAFRCHVVALAGSFHVTLAIHHAVVDGWSYARLVLELLVLYDARLAGRPAALPALPVGGHGAFLALERAALAGPQAADFWRAEADVPPLLLDRGRFAGPADPTARTSFAVDATTLDRLRSRAGEVGVPLKSLVLACHARALGRWAGREHDVVTGVTVNGRPETPGADLLVGLFLNTVPMRFADVGVGWTELGRAAVAAEQRALPYRRFPLARIEQLLGRPAFDASFNYTHFHGYRELRQLRGLRVDSWWSFDKTSFPFLVDFMVESRRLGTGVEIAYDPALVPAAAAADYARLYREALDSAAGGG